MNIYEKLQSCRVELQQTELRKSGKNKHANHEYFELQDFLPRVMELFKKYRLTSVVSFTADLATLTITDIEKPTDTIVLTSPMAEARLPTCHAIQNLGAVQTYQRRYLYINALEIVEHDALEPTAGIENSQQKTKTEKKAQEDNQQKIDKAQYEQIVELCKKIGWDKYDLIAHVKEKHGTAAVRVITKAQAEQVIDYLREIETGPII